MHFLFGKCNVPFTKYEKKLLTLKEIQKLIQNISEVLVLTELTNC